MCVYGWQWILDLGRAAVDLASAAAAQVHKLGSVLQGAAIVDLRGLTFIFCVQVTFKSRSGRTPHPDGPPVFSPVSLSPSNWRSYDPTRSSAGLERAAGGKPAQPACSPAWLAETGTPRSSIIRISISGTKIKVVAKARATMPHPPPRTPS